MDGELRVLRALPPCATSELRTQDTLGSAELRPWPWVTAAHDRPRRRQDMGDRERGGNSDVQEGHTVEKKRSKIGALAGG